MTLDDLLIDCCTRLNYPPALTLVEANVKARLTAFLNQSQLEILAQPSYRRLLRGEMILRTYPGQAQYGFPGFVSRVVAVIDPARQRRLDVLSVDAYRRYIPNPFTTSGTPVAYAFDGWSSTLRQPRTIPPVAYVYSPFDTAPTTLTLSGTTIIGPNNVSTLHPLGSYVENRVTVVLNSALPFPGVGGAGTGEAELSFIFDVVLSAPAIGTVSVVEADPALTPLAQIQPGQRRSRSPQIYLAPTPSGNFDLVAYYEREPLRMVQSSDEPMLPTRFHTLLSAGARMKEYELRGDTSRFAIAKREYDSLLLFLNTWISDQPDAGDQMHPDDGRFGGTSVLGPWFPASGYR